MHVRFASRQLERRYRESREGERAWGTLVERKYVMRIRQIQAAANLEELRGAASMPVHNLKGNRAGQLAAVLHGRWRLIFDVDPDTNVATILEVSNHYDD